MLGFILRLKYKVKSRSWFQQAGWACWMSTYLITQTPRVALTRDISTFTTALYQAKSTSRKKIWNQLNYRQWKTCSKSTKQLDINTFSQHYTKKRKRKYIFLFLHIAAKYWLAGISINSLDETLEMFTKPRKMKITMIRVKRCLKKPLKHYFSFPLKTIALCSSDVNPTHYSFHNKGSWVGVNERRVSVI